MTGRGSTPGTYADRETKGGCSADAAELPATLLCMELQLALYTRRGRIFQHRWVAGAAVHGKTQETKRYTRTGPP